jgi:putative membrane protein
MRTPIIAVMLIGVLSGSCGSSGNDAVSQADSANEAKADTAAGQTMQNAAAEEDSRFAVEAANGGMTEVELGKLAQEKASDTRVKEFGTMMVQDHSKANEELKALAAQKNITLPATPGDEQQKRIADMAAMSGRDFDKAYIKEMVKDHEKDVKLFEEAQKNVKDADMLQFIERTLPTLRAHLDHIKQLDNKK